MPVAWNGRGLQDDENVEPRERSDHPRYKFNPVTKHPPYVFSIRGVSCLVHKVASAEVCWWRLIDGGRRMVRLKRPAIIAHTVCSQTFPLLPDCSRTCYVPASDAVLCGRCHGEVATFGGKRKRANGLTKQEAHVKLGCIVKAY